MKYLILSLLVTLTSCSTCQRPLNPEVKQIVNQTAKKPYELNVYDCSNMAFDVALSLVNRGYDARIYCYFPSPVMGHAIVELHIKGKVLYIDPTLGVDSWYVPKPIIPPKYMYTPVQVLVMQQKGHVEAMIDEFISHYK